MHVFVVCTVYVLGMWRASCSISTSVKHTHNKGDMLLPCGRMVSMVPSLAWLKKYVP